MDDGAHVPVFFLGDQPRRRRAQPGGQHPIVGAGAAAPLEMPRYAYPCLRAYKGLQLSQPTLCPMTSTMNTRPWEVAVVWMQSMTWVAMSTAL